jgi:hypothetical protein
MVGNAISNESGSNWDLPSGVFPHLIEWVILAHNLEYYFLSNRAGDR